MSFTLPSVILKICQIVALAAGLGCVGYFTKVFVDIYDDAKSEAYKRGALGRQEFFLHTTGVGVVISIVGLVLNFSGLMNKKHNAVADEDLLLAGKSLCEVWDDAAIWKNDNTCGQMIGGIVSGFIATILYGVDAIFTFATSTEQS
ncbi:uncharacterized protein LOC124437610 isoform X2 [Xenia sp. Carnegie-2017]|uniref:uncharacterized protein LOC124437610 isoform X2 n=1 Tax=Xenia sp. Carnegie-2017 TaxID=2897299 RepID=UPI001F04BBD8|nr:uncharacterized protein LOC124437610 isoform X2 [Xenia sp. Carnegie-2017]